MTFTPGPHEQELIRLRDAPYWDAPNTTKVHDALQGIIADLNTAKGTMSPDAYTGLFANLTSLAFSLLDKNVTEMVWPVPTVDKGVDIANAALETARRATLPEGSLSDRDAMALRIADIGAKIKVPSYGILTIVTGFDPVAQVNAALAEAREEEAKRQLDALKGELDAAGRTVMVPESLPADRNPDPPNLDDFGLGPKPGPVAPIGQLPRPNLRTPGGPGDPDSGGDGDGGFVVSPPTDPDPDPDGGDPKPPPRYPDPRYPDPRYPDPRYPDPPSEHTPGPGGGPSVDFGGGGSNGLGPGLLGAGAGGLGLGVAGKLGSSMMGGPGGPIASHSVNLSITNPNGSQVTPGSLQSGTSGLSSGRGLLSGSSGSGTSSSTGTGIRNTMMGGGGAGSGSGKKDKPERRTGRGLFAPTFEETPIVLRSRGMMAGSRKPATQGED